MADRNGTLTANTVAMVTVETERVEVLNRDGAAEIWVSVGGSAPSVGDLDTHVFCLPAVAGAARVLAGREPGAGRERRLGRNPHLRRHPHLLGAAPVTLTYVGPTIGDGDLIVPAAQEAALDPLLAAAVGLWRASQLPDGWVHADGWGNEGSAGSAIDLIPYDGVSLDGAAAPSTPTLETSGDRGVEAVSADPNNAGDALMFQAGDDASLDMSGSFSFAIDFTPLTVSTDVSSIRFIRKIAGGILELPGFVVENTPPPPGYGDFAIALTAGTGSTFAVDYNAFILADPSAARHTVVVSVTPTTMKAWLDGVQLTNPFATADLTAVGSPENAQPLYIGVGQRLHNLVWWDDDLTDGEAQSIDALIRAA